MSLLTEEMSGLAGRWPLLVSTVVVPVGAVGFVLVERNPLRWGLWITYIGTIAGTVQVSPGNMQSTTDGWALPSTVPLEWHYRSHPGLTISEWQAGNAGAGDVSLLVVEELAQQ